MQRVKDLLKSAERNRWLFYGDSITHGAKHTNGSRDFSELFRERVIWELQRKEDLVLNSAFSGFSTTNLSADFEWRAAAFRPNAAFVMIGCNDSKIMDAETFGKQLNELLDKFLVINTLCILMTPLPVLRNLDTSRAAVPEFAGVVRRIAAERNLPLIDNFESWSKHPAAFYLHADILHPNEYGHRKIAQDIFRALDIFDEKSIVCRLFAPDAL